MLLAPRGHATRAHHAAAVNTTHTSEKRNARNQNGSA